MRPAQISAFAVAVLLTASVPAAGQEPFEARIAVATHNLRLLSSIPGETATEFTGRAIGIDAMIQLPRYRVSLEVDRVAADRSPVNAGRYAHLSVVALYGTPALKAEAGVGRRRGYSDRTDRDLDTTYTFVRLGARYRAPLGSSGFSVGIRGSLFLPADGDTREGATGLDAGTILRWEARRSPITAALEFRSERFRVQRGVQQELSVVAISAGWAFRRAP